MQSINQKFHGLRSYTSFYFHKLFSSHPQVLTLEQTVNEIVSGKSCARFGDGEFGLICGKTSISFQNASNELRNELEATLRSNTDELLICIPSAFTFRLNNYVRKSKKFWMQSLGQNWKYWIRELRFGYRYGDAQFTRPYMDVKNKNQALNQFSTIKQIWQGRDLLIVEGNETNFGLGNDLFVKARSIHRIECPQTNAFNSRKQILDTIIKQAYHGELVLIALGPTATILTFELSKRGIQAVDIGHLDVEYEWALRGSQEKVAIPGKYVNESKSKVKVVGSLDANFVEMKKLQVVDNIK
ncbi:GT-D fold domain-containing glycosyltransferase [Lacticaseibacillus baoqingensis]|uniref:GT-D fold domain-containing glycosyltransferase n=1 Tax=Lacticaseibacillus baoqingensis TaxID=2486013 RepID=A0ABW4E5P0_9LACO|nr:GT-D fold domain-containing glycosyltransferase [Lacticaseibacillus baoqingensis]